MFMLFVIHGFFPWRFLRSALAAGQTLKFDVLCDHGQQLGHGRGWQVVPTQPLIRGKVFHNCSVIATNFVGQIISRNLRLRLCTMDRVDVHCIRRGARPKGLGFEFVSAGESLAEILEILENVRS